MIRNHQVLLSKGISVILKKKKNYSNSVENELVRRKTESRRITGGTLR